MIINEYRNNGMTIASSVGAIPLMSAQHPLRTNSSDWHDKPDAGRAAAAAPADRAEAAFLEAWSSLDDREREAGRKDKDRIRNARVTLMRSYHKMNLDPDIDARDNPYDHILEREKALVWSAAVEAAMTDQFEKYPELVIPPHQRLLSAERITGLVSMAVGHSVSHVVGKVIILLVVAAVTATVGWVFDFFR